LPTLLKGERATAYLIARSRVPQHTELRQMHFPPRLCGSPIPLVGSFTAAGHFESVPRHWRAVDLDLPSHTPSQSHRCLEESAARWAMRAALAPFAHAASTLSLVTPPRTLALPSTKVRDETTAYTSTRGSTSASPRMASGAMSAGVPIVNGPPVSNVARPLDVHVSRVRNRAP
jgi:hypothetical protein